MASKKDLTKFLSELNKDELIKEIQKLYNKFPIVKTYFEVELSGDTSSLLDKAKEQIKNEFYPKRGEAKARSSILKKVIDDFIKVSIYPKDIVELHLFRFEMAAQFQSDYGDMDEPFYNSACSAFAKASMVCWLAVRRLGGGASVASVSCPRSCAAALSGRSKS